MDPNVLMMGTSVGMAQNDIPQDSYNMMTESNDTVVHPKDNLGNAHNTKDIMSPQAEVCISQETMASHDNPHALSIGLG